MPGVSRMQLVMAIVVGSVVGFVIAKHELADARTHALEWSGLDEFERSMFCAEWRGAHGIDRQAFVWHVPGGAELVDDCAEPRRWQFVPSSKVPR